MADQKPNDDQLKQYQRPKAAEIAAGEIAYHFDEMCRLINEHFGPAVSDPRQTSIIKLKLEEAMVWMLYVGMIRPRQDPDAPPVPASE